MNILELTGMKSTKYGGVESYFAELVKICRVDKFIFVYESMPISENYVNDINKWGGVILCKQSISTFQYFKFVIGVIKREKIDIVHFHFGSYLIAPFLRILFPRIRIISTRHSEIFVSNKLKKLYLKFCFFPFERFLCVSCGVKKEMIEGVGFSSKSEVLYLGVRKKKIVNPNLKKTLDIPKGVVVLTTIGFNIRIKGFDILVKSIQSLMDSNRLKNDIIVLVIGISENSEDSNSLRQLIAEAGLNRKIMSLGIRNDINDILVSAQIRALKCYLYLCWQFNPTIMYSSEDLERFYFQYQTEAVPHGVSLQSFCSTHNVPYNLFHKWYKDTRRKIVEVQVDGVPPVPPSDSVPSSPSVENPVKKDIPSPHAGNNHRNPCQGARVLPVRISVELTLSNGLHILQKDLDYPGLYRLIQKLEVLC